MIINENDTAFLKRMNELKDRSIQFSSYLESDFLSLYEQKLISKNINKKYFTFYGGFANCEKAMAVFGDSQEIGYSYDPEICFLHIFPSAIKFSEKLSHRDYLGAIMNLGIRRNTFGDLILKDTDAYTVCKQCIGEHIVKNLLTVKHTSIRCEMIEQIPQEVVPKLTDFSFVVTSERLDSILSAMYKISRSESKALVEHGKVLVDGAEMLKADYTPEEGNIITLSGHGKFIYIGMEKETKKGRLRCISKLFG